MGPLLKGVFNKSFLFCSLSFVGCFLLGLVLFFPLAPWTERLERLALRQGVALEISGARLALPLGVKVEEVAVGSPQFPHPPVRIQSLSVAPRWAALFGDNPGVSYRARAWHGTIDGVAYRDGSVAATLTDLRFDEPLGERLPLRLKGTLSSGSFDGVVPLQNKKRSLVRLEMDGLELAGLRSMGVEGDVVTLGKLDCLVDANGMTLTLKTFEIVGPELSASGSGFVRLGSRLERSLVNLTLDVKPGTGFDPFLLDMLKLGATAGNDGSYRIQLRGPLRSVQLVR